MDDSLHEQTSLVPVAYTQENMRSWIQKSEQLIQHSLDRLLQGRTTFVIAHRCNTMRNTDHIIVLDQGRIIESGQHEDLMSHKGKYFDMVERQTEHLAS